jgi:hypothetical protein
MKDLDDASYVLGIEIHRDRTKGVLDLSQKAYINKVLKRYNMHECSTMFVSFMNGDKLGIFQSQMNQLKINEIKSIPYALTVGSIMYVEVCMRPDLAFVTVLLGRFQSNPEIKHSKAAKETLCYLQGTKHYMLTYKKTDNLEVICYSDSDFVKCADSQKLTPGYGFTLANRAISWKSFKQRLTTSSTYGSLTIKGENIGGDL